MYFLGWSIFFTKGLFDFNLFYWWAIKFELVHPKSASDGELFEVINISYAIVIEVKFLIFFVDFIW